MAVSWPRLAIFCNSLGANQRLPSHFSNASRAARRSTRNGMSDSGGSIPSTASGLFSRCEPQNGHSSVTTLSSSSTIAPQAPHRVCVERPSIPFTCPFTSLLAYSLKSRSSTSPPASSTAVVWPQYGHFSARSRGSNSTFAPQLRHGNSLPLGGALVSVGSLSTGGLVGVGKGGGASPDGGSGGGVDMGDQRTGDGKRLSRTMNAAEDTIQTEDRVELNSYCGLYRVFSASIVRLLF